MKIILLTVFYILINSNANSQTTITGSIRDAVTNEKLHGVSVYVNDINKLVSSDYYGNFSLTDLPNGILKLQFSMLGYISYSLTIETDKVTDPIEVRLAPEEISTEEIIVTDSAVEKSYQSETINSKELMRQGAMNVSEAVTKIPGVWQLSTGTGISKPVIRGLYGNRIGIMINGIRFDNQQWQDEHGLVMSSDGIDNIEVIKGPKSLLFGPEAIGGIVSITDEHPAPIGKEIADLNLKFFSNTLGILGDMGFKGAQNNFNWLIRFGGETHADYLDGNSDRIPQTRFGGYTIKTAAGYMKGIWAGRINYSYTNYTYGILEGREFEREIASKETRFDRSFTGPHHALNVHNFVFQNTFIKERSKFRINTGYIYNRRKEQEGNDERFLPDSLQFGDLDMILKTASLDASWTYTLNKFNKLTIGTQGFKQSNVNQGKRRLIPDADVNSVSATAFLNYHKDKFTFEGGARFDLFSLNTTESGVKDSSDYFPAISRDYRSVNGSAGITYKLFGKLLFKANLSTGFRAPNLAELTSNGLHEGVFQYEKGNIDFKSEQSLEGDAAVSFQNRFFSIEISGYRNNINNYIFLGQTSDTIKGYPLFRYFQSDASLTGLEADMTFKPADWLNFRTTYSTVIAKRKDDVNLPLIPADKITSALHFELDNWKVFYSPYFELSVYTAFAKTRLSEHEKGVPGYTLMNAGFGCDLKFEKQLINITVSCNNLLNKVYTDFMSRIKLLNATYNGTTFFANNIGRNIVLAVKIPFKLSYN
ncbi:MAG: TonB-dependent receptor [Bacteroidetes bacterium]|nr:TonB-dependent receptor [Bacteroidota bacterium]